MRAPRRRSTRCSATPPRGCVVGHHRPGHSNGRKRRLEAGVEIGDTRYPTHRSAIMEKMTRGSTILHTSSAKRRITEDPMSNKKVKKYSFEHWIEHWTWRPYSRKKVQWDPNWNRGAPRSRLEKSKDTMQTPGYSVCFLDYKFCT